MKYVKYRASGACVTDSVRWIEIIKAVENTRRNVTYLTHLKYF